jgi:WD40 repeat protein
MDPPLIPDYTLLRPIGRGAYGEVWLARNVMGTLRAIKIIWRRQFQSDKPFEREFAGIQRYEPVSRSSGGLVHVLHVGRNDAEGYFYYVMELADWSENVASSSADSQSADIEKYTPRTLRSELKGVGRLPVSASLRLAMDVVSGLAQLHRRGLVHRDVKPANIIYVNERAKLADIGLVSTGGEGRTFVGTEGYIPPEGPGSAAADLFALGMVLYEASTGFPPENFPDVPSDWLTSVEGDEALEFHEIILKACEGQRERRYQSADEMQADLALLQSGESVRHMRAMKRRYVRLRASLAAGIALLACALGGVFFASYRARLAAESRRNETALREKAQEALTRTEAAEREARTQLYTALLEQARATVRSGELGQRLRAVEATRRAARISNTPELRGAAVSAMGLPDLRFERELTRPPRTTLVELDPAFKRIALCRGVGPVEIHSADDAHLLMQLPASTNLPAYLAWWSQDGRFLAVKRDRVDMGDRADIEIWDVTEMQRILLFQDVDHGIVAFHPRLPRIMAGLKGGAIGVWDLETTNQLTQYHIAQAPGLLLFSPDGEQFAAGSEVNDRGLLSIHRTIDGATLISLTNTEPLASIDWHPSGRWIATADNGGVVQLIDSQRGEAKLLGRHKMEAVLAAFSPDGKYLLSGGWERELICWDLSRKERAFTIPLNSFTAKFRADGLECAIINDNAVQFHRFELPSGCRSFDEDLGSRLLDAAFSPDGRWVAASASKRLGVWDLNNPGPGAVSEEGEEARLFFSPRGELFGSHDEDCFRWRVSPGTNEAAQPYLQRLPLKKPDGFASLCVASNDLVFTTKKGSCLLAPDQADSEPVWKNTARGITEVSPDGSLLGIFQPYSLELHIYHLPDFGLATVLRTQEKIATFEFSPTRKEIAVNCAKNVQIWSTADWQRKRELTNTVGFFYMPDGRTCWMAKDYRTAGLYDLRTMELLLPLPIGAHPLAVSADGRYLAVSFDAHQLQVWDLMEVGTALKELALDWTE